MRKRYRVFAVPLSVALLFGMSLTTTMEMAGAKQATAIRLNKTALTLMEGKSATLKLTGVTKKTAGRITWTSSKKSVATVKKKGSLKATVKAVKAGNTTITAKVRKKKYRCQVTVTEKTRDVTPTPVPTETPDAASGSAVSPVPAATYTQITAVEAKQMMGRDDGHVIVDVRREDEYAEGHIPGAILIPNETIDTEMPEKLPDLDQIILVYCRSGNRSKQASQKLADIGYTHVYEFGGIRDWPYDIVK